MTHLLKDFSNIKFYLLSCLMSMVCFAHFCIELGCLKNKSFPPSRPGLVPHNPLLTLASQSVYQCWQNQQHRGAGYKCRFVGPTPTLLSPHLYFDKIPRCFMNIKVWETPGCISIPCLRGRSGLIFLKMTCSEAGGGGMRWVGRLVGKGQWEEKPWPEQQGDTPSCTTSLFFLLWYLALPQVQGEAAAINLETQAGNICMNSSWFTVAPWLLGILYQAMRTGRPKYTNRLRSVMVKE